MNFYKESGLDKYVIWTCIIALTFIVTMINLELNKSKNKYKKAIEGTLIFIAFIGLIVIASKYVEAKYILNILMGFILIGISIGNISLIRLYKKRLHEVHKRIETKENTYVFLIIIILLNIRFLFSEKIDDIFLSITFVICISIQVYIHYSLGHYLNIYTDGIFLDTNPITKRIISTKEIITYDMIETIKISEYEKNKFFIEIIFHKNYKEYNYKCKINKKQKEEMVLIIKEFIEEEKIVLIKEY